MKKNESDSSVSYEENIIEENIPYLYEPLILNNGEFAKVPEFSARVNLPVGVPMNWKYVSTYTGNNVTPEYIKSKASVFVAGIMAVLSSKAKSKFFAGAATAEALRKSNYAMKKKYWTTRKYVSKDARNVYVKFEVKIYNDSARKKLVQSYTENHVR
ncbi:hypothetical protein [Brochothrix thermosphacta]|uniref:hypothetical protein n=1 Tax=Brochothrix thermosphacta TaxID=2756 RepID=UPI0004918806|nr:hypothetical protein [Brochothrix thermosphacta]ODJ51467.1 hypothetical protein BFR34_00825 [Brochothrix thermosphacta DSM 20171 = FSL F6-1036]SPN72580.1 conserved protein of unknown function [Brochothrix thermosphacta]